MTANKKIIKRQQQLLEKIKLESLKTDTDYKWVNDLHSLSDYTDHYKHWVENEK